jgi:hypothetical protein
MKRPPFPYHNEDLVNQPYQQEMEKMKCVANAIIALSLAVFTQTVLAADAPAKADVKNDVPAKADAPAKTPADRVVVMYFHRTQRCPTCLRMGSYSEEAVVKGFAQQIKDGTVEFHYVDFQGEKNAALTKGYKIGGPSLIVVKVLKDKAVEVKNLAEIWTKNRDKDVFLKYVRDNVVALQKMDSKTAKKADADTAASRAN